MGAAAPFYAPSGHEAAQSILVRTLDDVLWPAPARFSAPPPTVGSGALIGGNLGGAFTYIFAVLPIIF